MPVISGIEGIVNGHDTVRDWTINSEVELQPYTASNTKLAPGRVSGNQDWNGSFNAYGHTPAVMPRDTFTFTGNVDGTVGATGAAIVETVSIVVDIESGAIIAHTINFASNGTLTLGAAAATDVTTPDPPSAIGCKVQISDVLQAPSYSSIADVRSFTLNFSANNPTYASSDTAGFIKRVQGNIDLTATVELYMADPSVPPAANTSHMVRFFVDATTFWQVDHMRIGTLGNINVDVEGASPMSASLAMEFSGYEKNEVPTQVEGTIIKPSTTVYWPFP